MLADDLIDWFCSDSVSVCYLLKSYFYLSQTVDYDLGIDGMVVALVVQYLIDYRCYSHHLLVAFGLVVDEYHDSDLKYYFVCFTIVFYFLSFLLEFVWWLIAAYTEKPNAHIRMITTIVAKIFQSVYPPSSLLAIFYYNPFIIVSRIIL